MLSFHVKFVQTDRQTDGRTDGRTVRRADGRTDRRTTVKQYAPDLSIREHKKKTTLTGNTVSLILAVEEPHHCIENSVAVYQKYRTRLGELIIFEPWLGQPFISKYNQWFQRRRFLKNCLKNSIWLP